MPYAYLCAVYSCNDLKLNKGRDTFRGAIGSVAPTHFNYLGLAFDWEVARFSLPLLIVPATFTQF